MNTLKVLWMHIRMGTLTFGMVKDYFQGTFRYWIYNNMPFFMSAKDEQKYSDRYRNANPECRMSGYCINCGCKIPEMLFTDKGCKSNCHG